MEPNLCKGASVYREEWRKGRQVQEDARRDVDDDEEENWAVAVMWSDGDMHEISDEKCKRFDIKAIPERCIYLST